MIQLLKRALEPLEVEITLKDDGARKCSSPVLRRKPLPSLLW
jgi:hypothetical protein